MSTKIAVIIGDYSNGWSDAWIVQEPTKINEIGQLRNDREAVMRIMCDALASVIYAVESNEKINPVPHDAPCCEGFKAWVMGQLTEDLRYCGLCATAITPERRKAFAEQQP